jgi:hypothetical protein
VFTHDVVREFEHPQPIRVGHAKFLADHRDGNLRRDVDDEITETLLAYVIQSLLDDPANFRFTGSDERGREGTRHQSANTNVARRIHVEQREDPSRCRAWILRVRPRG